MYAITKRFFDRDALLQNNQELFLVVLALYKNNYPRDIHVIEIVDRVLQHRLQHL